MNEIKEARSNVQPEPEQLMVEVPYNGQRFGPDDIVRAVKSRDQSKSLYSNTLKVLLFLEYFIH